MIYDGVVAHLLAIDMEEMRKALFKQFGARKAKAAELNWGAVLAGHDYASKNLHQDRSVRHRADERDRRARSSSTATRRRRSAGCSPASRW